MASCAPVCRRLPMTRPTRKTLLASLLIAAWAAAMLAAYWWYEARYLRSFSEQTALFYGEQLRLPDELAGPGPIRLVHFWDPACPCNVGKTAPGRIDRTLQRPGRYLPCRAKIRHQRSTARHPERPATPD